VNNLLPQEEELYQGAEQFLEYCLAFDSPDVGVREFYNELAASKGIRSKDIAAKLSALHNKLDKFRDAFDKLRYARSQVIGACASDQPGDLGDINQFLEFCKESSNVKLLENLFRCNRKFYKLAADIAEDYWDYLLPEAREILQEIAYSILSDRTKNLEGWAWTLTKYLRSRECIRRQPLYKIGVLTAKCDDEALHFISVV
jgi:hypothetical protein